MNVDKTIKHMVGKIKDAELMPDPFPHLYIENIFPDDCYAEMIEHFPSAKDPYMGKLSNLYKNRFVLDLDDDKPKGGTNFRMHKDEIPKKVRSFWMEFRKVMMSHELMHCMLDKYSGQIKKEWAKNAYPTARLSSDLKGYSIGPHRDRDDKLVSVMFYTPVIEKVTDAISKNAGTELLIPKNPNMQFEGKHYSFDLFETVKVAEYRPNALFSWPVLEDSFHGVRPQEANIERTTVGYFIKTHDKLNRF